MKLVANRRRRVSRGFTLIELLLVLVILGVLAAIVVPKFTGRAEQAKQAAAKTDISQLKSALERFEVDNGRYPTADEGLNALVTAPADLKNWNRAYEKLPIDPWGNQYIYKVPGANGASYDLLSGGPDGREGGTDDIAP